MKMTCKYCGIVNKPHHCPHSKRKTDSSRIDKKIYKDKRWKKLREETLEEYNNICLWSLYVDGKIKVADTVHHIIEVLENKEIAYDFNNVVPLEYYNHIQVHELYKRDKNKVQELLRMMARDYRNADMKPEKYAKYFL